MSRQNSIAKNTVFLYSRMIVLMIISLYTSRLILKILGFEDYGIYNVVASVVVMFAFLNTSLSGATQRFLSFSLGKDPEEDTNKVFCTAVNLHIFLGFLLIVLLETIGLWFFYAKVNIPEDKMNAAFWTYQLSVAATFVGIVKVPYQALIIAYERMDFFAWLSILEAVLKLFPVLLIPLIPFDSLITYSFLLFAATCVVFFLFQGYCLKSFETAHYSRHLEKRVFKEMLGYSGWSLFGGVANIARYNGVNVLMNIYINVIVNAAMGISNQVSNTMQSFMANFTTAFSPRIVKLYAGKETQAFHNLIIHSSKFSFLLTSILCIPLIMRINEVLGLWLGSYPPNTAEFCVLALLAVLVDAFAAPLWTAIGATGRMKYYQIAMFFICTLVLPYSWIVLALGLSPVFCLLGNVFANGAMLVARVEFLKNYTSFTRRRFYLDVVLRGVVCFLLGISILTLLPRIATNRIVDLLALILISLVLNVPLFFLLYLSNKEKAIAKSFLFSVVKRTHPCS